MTSSTDEERWRIVRVDGPSLAALADTITSLRRELEATEGDLAVAVREARQARDEAARLRAERDEAGIRWGEHYNAALAAAQSETDRLRRVVQAVESIAAELTEEAEPEPAWHVDDRQGEWARSRTLRWAVGKLRAALAEGSGPTDDERPATVQGSACLSCDGSGYASDWEGRDLGTCSTCAGSGSALVAAASPTEPPADDPKGQR